MADLTTFPILLNCELGAKSHTLEYGVGHDNPGFQFKVDGKLWQHIPNDEEPDAPMEFYRGAVVNKFEGKNK